MSPKNQGRPPTPPTPDDAWASLDESDDWRDQSQAGQGGPERIVRTATNMRIRPEEAQRATKGPHLVVVAGAEVGRIYPLQGSPLTVGRGESNDLVLADGSVSREHARLELRHGRWYVHDLDSGNGTFVAAKRVRSAELAAGEQVAFGHVRLQLRESRMAPGAQNRPSATAPVAVEANRTDAPDTNVGPGRGSRPGRGTGSEPVGPPRAPGAAGANGQKGGATDPAASSAGSEFSRLSHLTGLSQLRPALVAASRTVWGKVALGVCVALLFAGWLAVFLEGRSSAEEVFHLCQKGAKAFDAAALDEAEQAFAQARALAPQHPRVLAWTRALRQGRADQERLSAAREALTGGNLALARGHLRALRGSALYAKVEALETELDRAEKALLVEAHTALQAGLQQEAGALLARLGAVPATGASASADTAEVAARPDVAALARWRQVTQQNAGLLAQVERWRQRPHKKPSLWEQASGQSPALRQALGAFRGAHAEAASRVALRALGHARSAKENQVSAALLRFATLWDTGVEEHRGKRAFAAIRVFTDAKQLALALGGDGSTPVRELNVRLADMYYVVGMQAFAQGKLPEAAEALRVALNLSPDHPLSARRMEEVEDRAVRMVDQAEFIRKKNPERARELARQVSAAMPSPSEVGGRARKLLQELGS